MDFPLITGETFHGRPSVADTAPEDAQIVDLSGYGTTLTDSNVTQDQTEWGRWYNIYNGSTSKHQNTSVNLPALKDGTALVWAYADFTGGYSDGTTHVIFELNDTANKNRLMLYKGSSNTWAAIWRGADSGKSVTYNNASFHGGWHQFGAMKKGIYLSIVIDGATRVTQGTATAMNANPAELTVGSNDTSVDDWKGYIDPEFTIWDYALSSEQLIREHNRLCHYFGRAKI